MKVVTPDWVLDSIDAGKRQDEAIYHPTCLKLKSSHHTRGSPHSPSLQKCNGDDGVANVGEQENGSKHDAQSPLPASGDVGFSALHVCMTTH